MNIFLDKETDYQLTCFTELYDHALKIPDMTDDLVEMIKDSEEYKAFSRATGSPVAMVDMIKDGSHIPLYKPFYKFYTEVGRFFWMIPCEIPGGRITGYLLRSFSRNDYSSGDKKRSYSLFQVKGTMPIAYGFHSFDTFESGTSIILTEGVKDALFLSQYYPYVVAVLTNSISDSLCNLITLLTKKVVVAFDVDRGGKRNDHKVTKRLMELGVQRSKLLTVRKVKDWANFFSTGLSDEKLYEDMHRNIKHALDELGDDSRFLY